jgi:hypothetical protein
MAFRLLKETHVAIFKKMEEIDELGTRIDVLEAKLR